MPLNKYVFYKKLPKEFYVKAINNDVFKQCCNFVANRKLLYCIEGDGYVKFTLPIYWYEDERHLEIGTTAYRPKDGIFLPTLNFISLVQKMIKNKYILQSYYM